MTAIEGLILPLVRSLVLVLGLSIAYLSYKAYLRTGTRYLRDASIGFTIIASGVFIEGILFELVGWSLTTVHIVESLIISLGFGVLLYSLVR